MATLSHSRCLVNLLVGWVARLVGWRGWLVGEAGEVGKVTPRPDTLRQGGAERGEVTARHGMARQAQARPSMALPGDTRARQGMTLLEGALARPNKTLQGGMKYGEGPVDVGRSREPFPRPASLLKGA